MHRWDNRLLPPSPGVAPTRPGAGPGTFTRRQLGSAQWRRVDYGLYVPAHTADSISQRIVEAAARLPGYGAVGGWAAAYWRGARLLDGMEAGSPGPVLLCLGPCGKIRKHPAVILSRARLTDSDVAEARGLPVTTAVRTAFDGARLAPTLVQAVVFLDMMLSSGLLSKEELAAYLPEHRPAWKGVGQARKALELADSAAKSPAETRLRMLWMLTAGLPRPLVNRPVFSLDGHLLGIPDLLEPESGTVGEYDGEDHRELESHTSDNAREEELEDHGLVVTRVTALDMRRRDVTVQRLTRAWSRGMSRDRRRDRWTLDQPDWYLRWAA
ncbi:MAG: hypothetical protein ACR2JU_06835 [Nocardioidaceae bacterium]